MSYMQMEVKTLAWWTFRVGLCFGRQSTDGQTISVRSMDPLDILSQWPNETSVRHYCVPALLVARRCTVVDVISKPEGHGLGPRTATASYRYCNPQIWICYQGLGYRRIRYIWHRNGSVRIWRIRSDVDVDVMKTGLSCYLSDSYCQKKVYWSEMSSLASEYVRQTGKGRFGLESSRE